MNNYNYFINLSYAVSPKQNRSLPIYINPYSYWLPVGEEWSVNMTESLSSILPDNFTEVFRALWQVVKIWRIVYK